MSAPDYLNNAQAWLVEKVLKVVHLGKNSNFAPQNNIVQ